MSHEAPSSDLLSQYDQKMKNKMLEVGAVKRKVERMLQKQCVWVYLHCFFHRFSKDYGFDFDN